ncbi:MAG: EI24 domain-containing protein [bacterium]
MNDFVFGFFYPLKCIKLFFKYPKLIVYSIVPVIINLIIYGTIFFYTYNWILGKTEDIIRPGDLNSIFIELIQSIVKIFSLLLVLAICYLSFVIFGGMISAPFNEKISRLIQEKLFEKNEENNLPFFKDTLRSILEEMKKIVFYFSIMIPLILIDFIPMIGSVITLVFGSAFSFFYNALNFLDYPMTRKLTGFRQKLKIVGSKKMLSFGFGAFAFLFTFLPVINVFFNPLLVAAGTRIFYEKGYCDILKE